MATRAKISKLIRDAAVPLPDPEDDVFGKFFDTFVTPQTRVVLLGEASHGTSEFYRSRAAITKRLIEKHEFNIVAVEADWPDASHIDRWVRHKNNPATAGPYELEPFTRFPAWMWQNTDVVAFLAWLRRHNADIPHKQRAGFYGLDLYNLNASMRAVIEYLGRVDPEAARKAKHRYGCLTLWASDPALYGMASLHAGYAKCEKDVIRVLMDLLQKQMQYLADQVDGEEFLNAEQNARLVTDAEEYYRAMYYGSAESWNLRDRHFFETLTNLLRAKGSSSRAVVWAHNSHIGDARFTGMGMYRGELNIGQLCREQFGSACSIIGFGTHAGTVAAAHEWDTPMTIMDIIPSRTESYERLFHDANIPRCLLDLRDESREVTRELSRQRKERFIGVIYRPGTEAWSHYSDAILTRQFDAYVWFDRTTAVTPLKVKEQPPHRGVEETYPFGL